MTNEQLRAMIVGLIVMAEAGDQDARAAIERIKRAVADAYVALLTF